MVGNKAWNDYARENLEKQFPKLTADHYTLTSPDTIDYNCVAWAAESDEAWWWTDPMEQEYWPDGVPREETLSAFIAAFKTIGYECCTGTELQPGIQKIAIYVDAHARNCHRTNKSIRNLSRVLDQFRNEVSLAPCSEKYSAFIQESDITRKSRLYSLASIPEMIQRGWITNTGSVDELEAQVCQFYNIRHLEAVPQLADHNPGNFRSYLIHDPKHIFGDGQIMIYLSLIC